MQYPIIFSKNKNISDTKKECWNDSRSKLTGGSAALTRLEAVPKNDVTYSLHW